MRTTTTQARVRTHRSLLACAVVSVLALSACSGDEDEPAASPPSGVSTESVEVVEPPADLAVAEVTDYTGSYRLHSVFRGPGECLDANVSGPGAAAAVMAACDGTDEQSWQITEVEPSRYQLGSSGAADAACLNGNDRTSIVHDGGSFAEPCRLVADQVWSITVVEDGSLRLHSELYGQGACLESNEAGSEVHGGAVFVADCADATGQFWTLDEAR